MLGEAVAGPRTTQCVAQLAFVREIWAPARIWDLVACEHGPTYGPHFKVMLVIVHTATYHRDSSTPPELSYSFLESKLLSP